MTDEIKPSPPEAPEPEVTPGLVPDPAPTAPPAPPAPDAGRADFASPQTPDLHNTGGEPGPEAGRADFASPQTPDLHSGAKEVKPSRVDPKMIGLGALTGAVLIALVLLGLMVFAPGVSPIKVGSVADAQRAAQERDVERVAARFASSLYTFNYRSIDADLDRIRNDSTGNFSRELAEVLGEVDVFKEAIVDAKGESVGQVQGVDVRKIEGDTSAARVFVLQAIRNRKNPEPRQQVSMVELTLVRTSGGWKVDDVQQLAAGSPNAAGTAPEEGS